MLAKAKPTQDKHIPTKPTKSNSFLPAFSIIKTQTNVINTCTAPRMIVPYFGQSPANPIA